MVVSIFLYIGLRGSNTAQAQIAKPPELRTMALRGKEFAEVQLQEHVNSIVAAMDSYSGIGISLKALRLCLGDRLGIDLRAQKEVLRTMAEEAVAQLATGRDSAFLRSDGRGRQLFTGLQWQDEIGIMKGLRGVWEPLSACFGLRAGNYGSPCGTKIHSGVHLTTAPGLIAMAPGCGSTAVSAKAAGCLSANLDAGTTFGELAEAALQEHVLKVQAKGAEVQIGLAILVFGSPSCMPCRFLHQPLLVAGLCSRNFLMS